MALAADLVGEHGGNLHIGSIARQALHQRAEGLRHGRPVDHGQHRHAEARGQIGGGRAAVEQAHYALDQDQIGIARGIVQKLAATILADHEQIELVDGRSAGTLQDHRIEEVGPALEDAHASPGIAMTPGERRGDESLALAGGWRGDHQRRTRHCRAHRSIPTCAFTPARKACFSSRIALTVSASAISSWCAARPVITTCCIGGRLRIGGSTSSSER